MNFKDFVIEHKQALLVIFVAILLSPLFAIAADAVGYSEPLEKSAEHLGAEESSIYGGILPDYSVPGDRLSNRNVFGRSSRIFSNSYNNVRSY